MGTTLPLTHEKAKHGVMLQPVWTRVLLLFVLAYEGLGGMLGGSFLIIKPNGDLMQMPVDLMHGVFPDFLIPGIILFSMGILSVVAFFITLRKNQHDWIWSGIVLCGWYTWFVTEIVILKELHWLHLMWGLPVLFGIITVLPLLAGRINTWGMVRALLFCGVLSSLWYVVISMIVPYYYPGFSSMEYTVSELSATGAPTRVQWVLLASLYPLLYAAFGWGVFKVAGNNKKLRILASLILLYSIINLYWPPMHTREAIAAGEKSLSDNLHITWAFVTVLLFVCMMAFGAAAFGKKFRIYTVVSVLLLIGFGILTSNDTPKLEADLPTPLMGLWERVNQSIFFLWVIVLSLQLIRKNKDQSIASETLI